MDILRGIMIGLGCFGLLIIGSCTMLGYGTMAVIDKAADAAEKEANNPDREATVERIISDFEDRHSDSDYSASTDEDYSDYGEPSVDTDRGN